MEINGNVRENAFNSVLDNTVWGNVLQALFGTQFVTLFNSR